MKKLIIKRGERVYDDKFPHKTEPYYEVTVEGDNRCTFFVTPLFDFTTIDVYVNGVWDWCEMYYEDFATFTESRIEQMIRENFKVWF